MRKLWTFNRDSDGFRFIDDPFRGTGDPRAASGDWGSRHGADGGGLAVRIGGDDTQGASGGWQTRFTLREDQNLTLTFSVRVDHEGRADRGDLTQILAAIDGDLRGSGASDNALLLRGGAETGWQKITVSLGAVEAGRHSLTLGGYSTEDVSVRFDTIKISSTPPMGAFEAEVLRLTNAFRAQHDLDPLKADLRLMDAAEDWSREMARRDTFAHSEGPAQVEAEGYEWSHWGENIAGGYTTPKAVVDGWIGSAGHRANMLNPDFTEIGIGYYRMDDDGGRIPMTHYWTQEFGTPHDALL